MRQVPQLADEKVTRLHCWGQSHHFWQKWQAQPSYETSLVFILLTWPTSNGVGLKKFDNFRTFTYVYWLFFSSRVLHWFGWSTYSLVVSFQPTSIYRPCYFNPILKERQNKKALFSLHSRFYYIGFTGISFNWMYANTSYIRKCKDSWSYVPQDILHKWPSLKTT